MNFNPARMGYCRPSNLLVIVVLAVITCSQPSLCLADPVAAAANTPAVAQGNDPLANEPVAGGDVLEFLAKVDAYKVKSPASALAACRRWLEAHPKASPDECYWLYARMSDMQRGPLNDPAGAIRSCQEGFARAGGKGSAYMLKFHEMDVLVSTNRLAEAEAIGAKEAATAAQQGFPQMLDLYTDVLKQQGKNEQAFNLVRDLMLQSPEALSDEAGRFYNKLIEHLLLTGREDEALSWAKLRFVLCPFSESAIQQATDSVSKVVASTWLWLGHRHRSVRSGSGAHRAGQA